MAVSTSTSTRKTKTRKECRAEQWKRAPVVEALADYDPEASARVARIGILREWPPCTCGADICPDAGAA
ncbi:hypothetical protein OG401_19410 [Kitasatospora purpeofusca]|uniref:hypothetical protein n=1 Tax=Kitasatospora TaxID=2063 RepID=UPI0022520CFB|nr:hypothetical protein [Kitasatospora purpeofusca]MCX4686451.1 hypothetical protein [Kitasatospora purpeofusca]